MASIRPPTPSRISAWSTGCTRACISIRGGIDHIVVDGSALRTIRDDTRLVWETDDVDVVTDGGEDVPAHDDIVAAEGEHDVEHHPDGFVSGPEVATGGPQPDPAPSIEDLCVDCANEAYNHRCGCCGFPLCGKHHEVQGGFCSRYFETPWAVCVWPRDVYVIGMPDHEVLQTPGEVDVFHVPADPSDDTCTAPACRPAEGEKERVAMCDVDAELCDLCEQEIRAAAAGGDET